MVSFFFKEQQAVDNTPPLTIWFRCLVKHHISWLKTHGLRFKKYLESRQQLAEKDKLLQKASTAHLPGREKSGELGKLLLVKYSGKLSGSIWGWLEVESQEGKNL